MGSTLNFGVPAEPGSKVSTCGSSATAEDIFSDTASVASFAEFAWALDTPTSVEESLPFPTPAAAAAAFGVASLEAGFVGATGCAGWLGAAVAATFVTALADRRVSKAG